jgi:hypothetical protein
MYTVKKGSRVSRPQPGSHYQTTLGGNNDVIIEFLLPGGSLVNDITAGEGKLVNLFLRCTVITNYVILLTKSRQRSLRTLTENPMRLLGFLERSLIFYVMQKIIIVDQTVYVLRVLFKPLSTHLVSSLNRIFNHKISDYYNYKG